jgi:hypothetical protein
MTSWRICDHTAFVISSPERVVVYNLDDPRTQPLALLGTGASIWQCLVGPDEDHLRPWCDEPDVLSELAEAYQTEPARISDDVRALFAQLRAGGYVESADPDPADHVPADSGPAASR